jgi:GrpB-like predicted nucleotidyltransferase (UPF0157 family)
MEIGLKSGIVRLVQYSPEWAKIFDREEKLLQSSIGEYIIEIQHIGSTSITGMLAKPIIDIGVAIERFEEGVVCIKPLEALGYIYNGENGIPRRHYFDKGDPTAYHLHILEQDSDEWKKHITFRDFLRNNEEAANEYARLKQQLARKFRHDRLAYTEGKSEFIHHILKLAEQG